MSDQQPRQVTIIAKYTKSNHTYTASFGSWSATSQGKDGDTTFEFSNVTDGTYDLSVKEDTGHGEGHSIHVGPVSLEHKVEFPH